MLFSLRELVQWLGFATFEIFLHGLALLVFSVLLVLKVDGQASALSWWVVFTPFFAADGLSTYFTTIVSVRLFQDGEKRLAVLRLFWILTILSLKFVFEMLLCQKLVEHTRELWYGLIMSPVFILLQLLMIRACRYGMVFDAGSSHTSLFVYEWDSDKENNTGVVSQTLSCDVQGQYPPAVGSVLFFMCTRVDHPCYPKDYAETVSLSSFRTSPCTNPSDMRLTLGDRNVTLEGRGNASECLAAIKKLFNFSACGQSQDCTFDGVYQPPVSGQFIAFSAFYYNFKFLNLTEGQSLATVRETIEHFCTRSWEDSISNQQ
ncbi:hypothetical protein llap_17601 [Limosa lapponica baueri]|uniref:Transmembrane protein 203 n=1 Tax=Limosa lapponica baueri TaxID=1758121 RepID=A0A2I0TE66_LIMLA|nr:hypothetical protein llap_17601 [Limosa lapponica baueri]